MSTAAQQVLSTAELLEIILVEVGREGNASSMRTLLFAQRVNMDFRAIIQRSKQIRRALWLENDPKRPGFRNPLIRSMTSDRAVIKFVKTYDYKLDPKLKAPTLPNSAAHYQQCGAGNLHWVVIKREGVIGEHDEALKQSWHGMMLVKGTKLTYRVYVQDVTVPEEYTGNVWVEEVVENAVEMWKFRKELETFGGDFGWKC